MLTAGETQEQPTPEFTDCKVICWMEAVSWFPAAQPQNNHTETVLFKSLLGPLALAFYQLTLTS